MRQQISFRRLYDTILCIGCIVPFCNFHLLVEHMVRGIGSTILYLKWQNHIFRLLQLLWEMVLGFLFLGIQLGVVWYAKLVANSMA